MKLPQVLPLALPVLFGISLASQAVPGAWSAPPPKDTAVRGGMSAQIQNGMGKWSDGMGAVVATGHQPWS